MATSGPKPTLDQVIAVYRAVSEIQYADSGWVFATMSAIAMHSTNMPALDDVPNAHKKAEGAVALLMKYDVIRDAPIVSLFRRDGGSTTHGRVFQIVQPNLTDDELAEILKESVDPIEKLEVENTALKRRVEELERALHLARSVHAGDRPAGDM